VKTTLHTSDGVVLEARIDAPTEPQRAAVLCHADPKHSGTMHNPLMVAVSRRLVERGHLTIRFNFRGTGDSEGTHDLGNAETADVEAAIQHARGLDLPIGLAGWSFGAVVALNWLARHDGPIPYVGIAPGPERLPAELPPGPKRIILGTREQVIDGPGLQRYAIDKGIDLVLTPGDHFFHGRGAKIGDLVGQGLEV
jgi:alpha/beta superfamily hydrolase